MKTASAALQAFVLQNRKLIVAELYTFTLTNGEVIRMTTFDQNVTVGGNTYKSTGAQLKRGKIQQSIGLSSQPLQLTIQATIKHLTPLSQVPLLQAIAQGYFDGALFELDRLIFGPGGVSDQSLGVTTLFVGVFGDAQLTPIDALIKIDSDLKKLNLQWPFHIIQPSCHHTLFDPECTLNRASFAVAAIVSAGSTPTIIQCNLVQASGYFAQGDIYYPRGGVTYKPTVKLYTTGVITLNTPLPFSPNAGDTFTAYPGCDFTQATCSSRFNNLANYGGQDYTPVPESIL